ncbi:MAG: prepilin-type N-terminal cleavage/methylation domain-containing protein [Acidobacteriia bacterium]|nr:prepilin-type N-terminal cleavage/methylation domain-containing protein [Terriglobia bacterium]
MRTQKGFSLIELLIVIAIILIIAAIAIPNLLHSRMAANEAAGAQTVRMLITNEIAYSTSYPTVGYAPNIGALGGTAVPCTPGSASACLIDGALGCAKEPCLRDAYLYSAKGVVVAPATVNTDFIIFATPNGPVSGNMDFCSTSDGVPRYNGTGITPPTAPIANTACVAPTYNSL